jgi:hypothetical protein
MSTIPSIYEMQQQIEERIKAARPSHVLYNPSDEWVSVMCNGAPINIPPDGKAKGPDGKTHTYDGTIAVKDTYGVDPEALRKARQQGQKRPDLPQNKVVLSALEAVSHAVRKRHARGIVFLTGNAETDKELKAQARATWIEYKKDQSERAVNAFRQQTAAFHADPRNVGQPAPAMPEHVQAAQEFLDDYRLGKYERRNQFACPANCGYYTDNEERLATHVRASHPLANLPTPAVPAPAQKAIEEPQAPAAEPEAEAEPSESEGEQPRRPGRPRKVPY